jgi:hypothetical protein
MEEEKYKSFWEFLVRTPSNLIFSIAGILFAILMVGAGIASKDSLHPTVFIVWTSFFTGIPFGIVLRVYLIYKRVNKLNN